MEKVTENGTDYSIESDGYVCIYHMNEERPLWLSQGDLQNMLQKAIDDYKLWYSEAIEASNECGFACMSAADVIRYQDAEIQRLREIEAMYNGLCD